MENAMDPALRAYSPETNGMKRKSVEGPATQQRAKRNRYISIACNECKRRKIKCNGNQPCQRCGNLNLECVYAPNCCGSSFKESEEYRQMTAQIASLQDQVNTLYANLSSLRSELAVNNPLIDPSLQNASYVDHPSADLASPDRHVRTKSNTGPRPPGFRGLTSDEYHFDIAKSSLQTMGITPGGSGMEEQLSREVSPVTDGYPNVAAATASNLAPEAKMESAKDPIWSVSKEEALRLLQVYEDELHDMYPVVSLPHLTAHVHSVYKFIDAAVKGGLVLKEMPGSDRIDDDKTNLLKLVLAIAMIVEGTGRSELGQRMFECVQPQVDSLLHGNAGVQDVMMLVLAALYNFHGDNESTAWRVIGLTARLCVELGLHRKETYDPMTQEQRDATVSLFWSVYILDKRWSFGTGMPFALQDADLDPSLPRPGDKQPYLNAMIDYCFMGSRVWRAIGPDHAETDGATKNDIKFLDYQLNQWHRSLPEDLRWDPHEMRQGSLDPFSSPSNRRLKLILYLRRNTMSTHIYRPVLHSATSIVNSRSQAQGVVDVAKETIRVLTYINQTTAFYHKSQILFNSFLTSALAVLFLAVSHTPALFADQVREEFYLALDLVRGFSRDSWISKRLWKTIRVLKQVGPKLGLIMREQQRAQTIPDPSPDDQSHSAAVAMAGLAGHNVDERALYRGSIGNSNDYPASASLASCSPDNMANDLTSLFQAIEKMNDESQQGWTANGGHNGFQSSSSPGEVAQAQMARGVEGQPSDKSDALSRIMQDLF